MLLRATSYYKVLNMPVIAGDSRLYIDGLSMEKQLGLYGRRVAGRVFTDGETIDYYASLAKSTVSDRFIHYFTGISLITSEGTFAKEIRDSPLKLSSISSPNRNRKKNPLDVISLVENGRYFHGLSDEERVASGKKGEQEFTDFIVRNVIKQIANYQFVVE